MSFYTRQPLKPSGFRRRVFSAQTVAALTVAITLIALASARVFEIDWSDLTQRIGATDPLMYGLALVAYYASFWFRGLRWQLIARTARIEDEHGVRLPGIHTSSGIILMGWFVNSVAPFRLGDAYRGWEFSKQTKASLPISLSTVFVERVQDMATVLVLVLGAAIWLIMRSEAQIPIQVIYAAVAMGSLLLVVLLGMRVFGTQLATMVPSRFKDAYGRFQTGTLRSFRPRSLPSQLMLGIVGWMLEILRFYLVSEGLGFDLNFSVVMFAALASAMLTTLPTPGGLGFVEAGLSGVLALVGLDESSAAALTIVDRSISWLSVILFGGLLFIAWQALSRKNGRPDQEYPSQTK